jgi:hypothetical protein
MKKQLLSDTNHTDKEDEMENPTDYIRELEIKQRMQDVNNLRLLELCKEYIVGINTIDIISGKNKFTVTIQELDIFDLFPMFSSFTEPQQYQPGGGGGSEEDQPSSAQHGKKKNKAAAAKRKTESMEAIFKRTNITRNKKR